MSRSPTYSLRVGTRRAADQRASSPLKKGVKALSFLIIIAIAGTVGTGIRLSMAAEPALAQERPAAITPTVAEAPPVAITPAASLPAFDATRLQTAVSAWAKSNPSAGVVVADTEGTVLAQSNADTSFFGASIYKLYVAYEGYRLIDQVPHIAADKYVGAYTRAECLDLMIRESHSPCAEKMLAEIGRDALQLKLTEYGLTGTSLKGLTTTAHDTNVLLARITKGQDLQPASRDKLMASMLAQKYRYGIPKGMPSAQVYNKVGFKDYAELHDVAVVTLKDGRTLLVSVFTVNSGASKITKLAGAIQAAVE